MRLSVIIPVYNIAPYLDSCLQSIKDQTYRDFEIILIDDGSTDNSRDIALSSLGDWPYSLIVTQENQGVSAARNKGLELATGDYVTFLDSDDYVKNDYIETLLRYSDDMDLLISGVIDIDQSGKEQEYTRKPGDWSLKAVHKGKRVVLDYMATSFAILFKKEIIQRFCLRFNIGMSLAEDRDFNIEYLSHIDRVRLISYSGYYHRTGVINSLTSKHFPYEFENNLLYWQKMYHFLGDDDKNYFAHRLFFFIVDGLLSSLHRHGVGEAVRQLREVRPLIDIDFLLDNLNVVIAPLWQKRLLRFIL